MQLREELGEELGEELREELREDSIQSVRMPGTCTNDKSFNSFLLVRIHIMRYIIMHVMAGFET